MTQTDPSPAPDELVISRLLRASRGKVWAAWTDPAQLCRWWGPKGFDIGVARGEVEAGGLFVYWMQPPGGGERWWGRFAWREVTPMDRLVWVNSFSDPDGAVTRPPFAPTFPAGILNVVTFEDAEGGTRMTLRGRPIDANAEELATYEGMRPSMHVGFGGTFDQLDAFLAESSG